MSSGADKPAYHKTTIETDQRKRKHKKVEDHQCYKKARITLDDLNMSNSLWDVDYNMYEFNGTITSKVIINGVATGSKDDLLGVFVNGECRGLAKAMKSPFAFSSA